jgi:hypothetical protein
MSLFPSLETVKELWPRPYCEVAALLLNTGWELFVHVNAFGSG